MFPVGHIVLSSTYSLPVKSSISEVSEDQGLVQTASANTAIAQPAIIPQEGSQGSLVMFPTLIRRLALYMCISGFSAQSGVPALARVSCRISRDTPSYVFVPVEGHDAEREALGFGCLGRQSYIPGQCVGSF